MVLPLPTNSIESYWKLRSRFYNITKLYKRGNPRAKHQSPHHYPINPRVKEMLILNPVKPLQKIPHQQLLYRPSSINYQTSCFVFLYWQNCYYDNPPPRDNLLHVQSVILGTGRGLTSVLPTRGFVFTPQISLELQDSLSDHLTNEAGVGQDAPSVIVLHNSRHVYSLTELRSE